MVCDFAEPGLQMNVAGGPSDRPLSPLWASGLEDWKSGAYQIFGGCHGGPETVR
jgi:hypothetical protein